MHIPFSELRKTSFFKDAVYESNEDNNFSGEVISKLLNVGNQSGFRKKLQKDKKNIAYLALESTGKEEDYKDQVDGNHVVYFGDNRKQQKDILNTKQGGNKILYRIFMQFTEDKRVDIPPIFYFTSEEGRSRRFVGLLVPGHDSIPINNQLEIIQYTDHDGFVFSNYRAHFTIMPVNIIDRRWLDDLLLGRGCSSLFVPDDWKKWIKTGFISGSIPRQIESVEDTINEIRRC